MLKGIKIIFRFALSLLYQMRPTLMHTKEFGKIFLFFLNIFLAEIFEYMETFPKKLVDMRALFKTADLPKFKIKNRYIRALRKAKREIVEQEYEKLQSLKIGDFKAGTYQRLKFLNKFYLYSELTKHAADMGMGQEAYEIS
jgi:hypothetical protein